MGSPAAAQHREMTSRSITDFTRFRLQHKIGQGDEQAAGGTRPELLIQSVKRFARTTGPGGCRPKITDQPRQVKRSGNPPPRHTTHYDSLAILTEVNEIIKVATDHLCRQGACPGAKPGRTRESDGLKAVLNLRRQTQFLVPLLLFQQFFL